MYRDEWKISIMLFEVYNKKYSFNHFFDNNRIQKSYKKKLGSFIISMQKKHNIYIRNE